jgi:hypothetical protein
MKQNELITIECPECGNRQEVQRGFAYTHERCVKCDTLIYVVPPENRKEVVPPMAKGEPEFRFKWQHIVFIVVALAFLAFVLFWICMLYAVTSWE